MKVNYKLWRSIWKMDIFKKCLCRRIVNEYASFKQGDNFIFSYMNHIYFSTNLILYIFFCPNGFFLVTM